MALTEPQLEEVVERYKIAKAREKEIKKEIKHLQGLLEEHFRAHEIEQTTIGNTLVRWETRLSVSYNDEEVKRILEPKGLWPAVVTTDKRKLEGLVKAKLVTREELEPARQVRVTRAWVIKEIQPKEGGNGGD